MLCRHLKHISIFKIFNNSSNTLRCLLLANNPLSFACSAKREKILTCITIAA